MLTSVRRSGPKGPLRAVPGATNNRKIGGRLCYCDSAKRDMSRYVATDSLIYQMQAQWYKRSMNRSSTTNTAICGSLWTEQGGEKVTLHIF